METTTTAIQQFILAGKSFFTVENTETGGRYTYKVVQCEDDGKKKDLWFVSLLNGSDNENSYQYIGIIGNGQTFKTTAKTKVTNDSIGLKGFKWLWSCVSGGVELPSKVSFYHAGKCGRCGRKLTTPESIESGFGPVCLSKM